MGRDDINAFLGAGTEYRGDLNFKGAVRIDGRFEGRVTSDGTLIIGQDAFFKGTVEVAMLICSGTVQGDATMAQQATFHKSARFSGALVTPVLVVEEGAQIDGTIAMSKPQETGAASVEE